MSSKNLITGSVATPYGTPAPFVDQQKRMSEFNEMMMAMNKMTTS
jgi:hypothetical protein